MGRRNFTDLQVHYSADKNYIELILNRPTSRNALNTTLIQAIKTILKKINSDKNIYAVCLSGADHFFCAGADLHEMKLSQAFTFKQNILQAQALSELFYALYTLKKPVISIVEGGAYGGGIGLAACSDIVISSKQAKFCFSEVKLGLVPALISPYVTKAIGERQAKRFFLTGEVFDAYQAQKIGLVHEIKPPHALEAYKKKLLALLISNSLQAMGEIKKLGVSITPTTQQKLIKLLAKIRTSQMPKKEWQTF